MAARSCMADSIKEEKHMFGSILMILGANLVVGSVAAAVYRAAFECALGATHASCNKGTMAIFLDLMTSGSSIVYWLVIVIGIAVFWHGKRLRARDRA